MTRYVNFRKIENFLRFFRSNNFFVNFVILADQITYIFSGHPGGQVSRKPFVNLCRMSLFATLEYGVAPENMIYQEIVYT